MRCTPQCDIELMSKKKVLSFKPPPRFEQVGDNRTKQMKDRKHRIQRCADSVSSRESAGRIFRERQQVLSAGAAAMSLVLAAHALGYGANWITEWYAYDRGVLDVFGLAPHERIAGFIHIGRPPGPPEDRPRPPLSEIAVRFTA